MIVLCVLFVVLRVVFDSVTFFFFQAEDGIRDLVRSRGLGDVYKRQNHHKTRIMSQSVSQRATGLVLNQYQNICRKEYDLSLIHI